MATTKRLPADAIAALTTALQEAANAAIRADPRDQTPACLVGAHLLGLWPKGQAGVPTEANFESVREVSYIATAALNTACFNKLAQLFGFLCIKRTAPSRE